MLPTDHIRPRQLFSVAILFALVALFACSGKNAKTERKTFKTIIIQPFVGMSKADAVYVTNEIAKIYPHVSLKEPIVFPASAYNPARKRYRADSLIHFLNENTSDGFVTIGLTSNDISTTKDEIADWGVMGLGYQPGRSCIASTFRLSKSDKLSQLFKVSIHELGHSEGLPHCSVKTCFMRDADGKNPTNEEKEFCPECKSYLIKKGWKFE